MNKYSLHLGTIVKKALTINERREAIKQLIKQEPIENQTMLVEMLKKRFGINTNQSIVSRDLNELNVTKHKYKDTMIYELKETNASKEILRLGVRGVTHNESLIVVNTLSGLASFVGDYLDQCRDARTVDILGTIGGENTVFVVPASIKNIGQTYVQICTALHYKELKENDENTE